MKCRAKVRNYAEVAQCEGSKQKDLSFFKNLVIHLSSARGVIPLVKTKPIWPTPSLMSILPRVAIPHHDYHYDYHFNLCRGRFEERTRQRCRSDRPYDTARYTPLSNF